MSGTLEAQVHANFVSEFRANMVGTSKVWVSIWGDLGFRVWRIQGLASRCAA